MEFKREMFKWKCNIIELKGEQQKNKIIEKCGKWRIWHCIGC